MSFTITLRCADHSEIFFMCTDEKSGMALMPPLAAIAAIQSKITQIRQKSV
jgi:hypothetical protein